MVPNGKVEVQRLRKLAATSAGNEKWNDPDFNHPTGGFHGDQIGSST